MKLHLCLGALLLSVGFTASAEKIVTVDHMTCKHAQTYAAHYGRYWKDAGPDGAIPIYPINTLDSLRCGKAYPRPQMERTLDNPECILSYYCNSF